MEKKLPDLLFLGAILLILTAGLTTALLFPKEINTYENRKANQMPSFTLEGYLDGSFQEEVDAALSDQVNLSTTYKRAFNYARTATLLPAVLRLSEEHPDRYISYQGMWLFGGDRILPDPRTMESIADDLDAKIANYNETFARLPDVSFYLYYIEGDTSMNFETGEKPPIYERILDELDLPRERVGRLEVDSFDTLYRLFYHTDHHWNHLGSYQGYLDVLDLLGVEDQPLVPLEEVPVPGRFVGSRAVSTGSDGLYESVSMYRFDFPALTAVINGRPADNYGSQELFWSGQGGQPSYGGIYGGDEGEVILSGGDPGGGKILLIGESNDNALLKLLASHFDTLYAVDLRNYSHYMGEDFRLSEYLEEHGIDKVLLIGAASYLAMDEFRLEG